MHILVFGATGKTGRQIVSQAIDRGDTVTAYVRDNSKLDAIADKLHIVEGDIQNHAQLTTAFSLPVDAVVSALGIFHREPRTELSEGTRNILQAMAAHDVSRLLVVSSLGAGESKGQGNFLARNLQKLLLSHVLDDKNRQEVLISESDSNWTIIRPPQLTDAQAISNNVVVWQGLPPAKPKPTWKTSRATVANFLLNAMHHDTYIKEAVNISESKE